MTDVRDKKPISGFNRRAFISGAAGAATLPLLAQAAGAAESSAAAQDPSLPVDVTLQVNGTAKSLNVDARTTLLDALREHIGLTGTKKRLRSRPVWGLHRHGRGSPRTFMPDPGADRAR